MFGSIRKFANKIKSAVISTLRGIPPTYTQKDFEENPLLNDDDRDLITVNKEKLIKGIRGSIDWIVDIFEKGKSKITPGFSDLTDAERDVETQERTRGEHRGGEPKPTPNEKETEETKEIVPSEPFFNRDDFWEDGIKRFKIPDGKTLQLFLESLDPMDLVLIVVDAVVEKNDGSVFEKYLSMMPMLTADMASNMWEGYQIQLQTKYRVISLRINEFLIEVRVAS